MVDKLIVMCGIYLVILDVEGNFFGIIFIWNCLVRYICFDDRYNIYFIGWEFDVIYCIFFFGVYFIIFVDYLLKYCWVLVVYDDSLLVVGCWFYNIC